jgi:hypothetical protein
MTEVRKRGNQGVNRNPIVREMGFIVRTIADRLAGFHPDPATGLPDRTRPRPLTAVHEDVRTIEYLYGHPAEIVGTLREWSDSPEKRMEMFPLVALFEDIPVEIGKGPRDRATLHLVICMSTRQDWRSSDRQAQVFEPVLYPIYDALLEEIARRQSYFYVMDRQKDMPHMKLDRKFWGKEGLYGGIANPFNDFVDAIEIRGFELQLHRPRS